MPRITPASLRRTARGAIVRRARTPEYIVRATREWAEKMVVRLRSAFDAGGHQSHGGKAWEPRKQEYPWPILNKSGELKNKLQKRVVQTKSGMKVHFFSTATYFKYHQNGTVNMPARPPVEITRADLELLRRTIMKHKPSRSRKRV